LVCRLSSVAAAVVAFLVARRLRRRRLRRLTPPCTSCFSGPSLSRPASRSLVPSPSGALARALRSRRARGMAPGAGGGRQGGDESWPASIPQVSTGIVKTEHRHGHKPFQSYSLPSWVRHPDKQKCSMYLQPEDYMGCRKRHNDFAWNVAHVGAQCGMFDGQGFRMLEKA
ncbi:unnamed protein product, partial [Prorocentrum cordatum]